MVRGLQGNKSGRSNELGGCYSYLEKNDNDSTYGGDCGDSETYNIEKMFWK